MNPPRRRGRRAGVPNKVNAEFRDTVRKLIEDNADNFQRWLTLVAEGDGTENAKPDPAKALDLITKLAEYAAPKLARVEHSGKLEVSHSAEELSDDELADLARNGGG